MKVTYYLEVLSSWCYYVEPVWEQLKQRYAGRAEFEWRIALMRPEDFPASRTQCERYYERSGGTVMRLPYRLNSAWFEPERKGHFEAPNLVAEAARSLGIADDRVRNALSHAGLREGVKVGDLATAARIAAAAAGIPAETLQRAAESQAVRDAVATSTAGFHALQITQRPAFVLTDEIGDKAVFSGLVRIEPLAATIDAMLADTAAYAAHRARHGDPA
jgi:predicted DsbA family dithiol-disulfide isomerase